MDDYHRTVFGVTAEQLGAKNSLGGGGRYDRLVADIGGPDAPAVGFGTGLERIIMALESGGVQAEKRRIEVFFAVLDEKARPVAVQVIHELRGLGVAAGMDYAGRKLKGQMKQANRLGARRVVIIGEDEMARGEATVRDMDTGMQEEV